MPSSVPCPGLPACFRLSTSGIAINQGCQDDVAIGGAYWAWGTQAFEVGGASMYETIDVAFDYIFAMGPGIIYASQWGISNGGCGGTGSTAGWPLEVALIEIAPGTWRLEIYEIATIVPERKLLYFSGTASCWTGPFSNSLTAYGVNADHVVAGTGGTVTITELECDW